MDNYFVLAIDLGSQSTKIVAASPDASQPFGIKILHYDSQTSRGIHRGSVSNPDEAAKVVRNLIAGAATRIAPKPSKKTKTPAASPVLHVCVNVNGANFKFYSGRVKLDLPTCSVSAQLVNKLFSKAENAAEDSMPGYLVQHLAPLGYSIDNAPDTLEVLGKECSGIVGRFFGYGFAIGAVNGFKEVFSPSYQPSNYYATTSAKAVVVSTSAERNSGVVVVDLGAETTGVAVFVKNEIKAEFSIPFGSDSITRDVMKGLQLDDYKEAEYIKTQSGINEEHADSNYLFDLPSGEKQSVSVADLNFFIKSRLEEIAAYVSSCITAYGKSVSSIILTGGGAKLKSVCDVFAQVCEIPTRVAETHFDLEDDVCQNYAAAIGMASMFCREYKDRHVEETPADEPESPVLQNDAEPASTAVPASSAAAQLASASGSQAQQPVMAPRTVSPDSPTTVATVSPASPAEPVAPSANAQTAAQPSKNIFGKLGDKMSKIFSGVMTDDFNNI